LYKKLVGLELAAESEESEEVSSDGAEMTGGATGAEGAGVDDEASVSVSRELVEASEESLVVVDTVNPVDVAISRPDELDKLAEFCDGVFPVDDVCCTGTACGAGVSLDPSDQSNVRVTSDGALVSSSTGKYPQNI
jgi:hypothetical protein